MRRRTPAHFDPWQISFHIFSVQQYMCVDIFIYYILPFIFVYVTLHTTPNFLLVQVIVLLDCVEDRHY